MQSVQTDTDDHVKVNFKYAFPIKLALPRCAVGARDYDNRPPIAAIDAMMQQRLRAGGVSLASNRCREEFDAPLLRSTISVLTAGSLALSHVPPALSQSSTITREDYEACQTQDDQSFRSRSKASPSAR